MEVVAGDPTADQARLTRSKKHRTAGQPGIERKQACVLSNHFFIAFSMYSKIPMPQFEWKDEDMRYALCFFPWVGAVIGVLWYLWKWICDRFAVGTLCYAVVGTAIPILVTGGFHVDGF